MWCLLCFVSEGSLADSGVVVAPRRVDKSKEAMMAPRMADHAMPLHGATKRDGRVGIVVIGRNEGSHLEACLRTVIGRALVVIYVDSGSSDDSVVVARSLGCDVVALDAQEAFTAARARNEGLARLRVLAPDVVYVQFVDGDCQVVNGWIEAAITYLDEHADVAGVCGRRREKYPQHSIYNLLCDIEWDTPVGEAASCGGDVMMRVDALTKVNGYRTAMIAGEEPELCARLRAAGWRIWRLADEMTLHDAALAQFSQWWQRTMRSGHAFAEVAHLHGASSEHSAVRASWSAWFWGLGFPLVFVAIMLWCGMCAAVVPLVYIAQIVRLALRGRRSRRENWWYATFLVIGKFPEVLGQIRFLFGRMRGAPSRLIEYKSRSGPHPGR